MSNVAIVLGAGSGTRMKSNKNKTLLDIAGKPVLRRSVEAFDELEEIDKIIVTFREEDLEEYIQNCEVSDKVTFVKGGATRQESVYNALKTVDKADYVIIHDGARPFIKKEDILKTLFAAKDTGAAATGVFVKDTIKVVDKYNFVLTTPQRSTLFAVQTPQIFRFDLYKKAMQNAIEKGLDCTDDCQIAEAFGVKVKMVEGSYTNIKITTPEDIALGESIIRRAL